MIQSQINLRMKLYISRTVVPLSRWVVFILTTTVVRGDVGVGGCGVVWVWGGMGMGVGRWV